MRMPKREYLAMKASYRVIVAVRALSALLMAAPIAEKFSYTRNEGAGLVFVPMGFDDTAEDGRHAALQDIHRNSMMFALYGDVQGLQFENYRALGITPVLMGCEIGGKGWGFWTGYNRSIIQEVQRRGYNFGRWGLVP
jgi:hypothetical protein